MPSKWAVARSTIAVSVLVSMLTLVWAVPALGASVLDQLQPTVNNSLSATYAVEQTFTAGITGRLDSVSLYPVDDGIDFGYVAITDVVAGEPGTTTLAVQGVGDVPEGAWVDVDFTTPAMISAGTSYAISVGGGGTNELGSNSSGGYSGGNAFVVIIGFGRHPVSADIAFKTFVTPTNQPDLRIRKPGGALKGNDVYSTATGQAVYAGNAPGTTRQFVLTVQNDGSESDSFKVDVVSSAGSGNWSRSYKVGWQPPQDITTAVDDGLQFTPLLGPGEVYTFRVYVTPAAIGNSPGTFREETLQIQSQGDPAKFDQVRWRVTVI